MWQEIGKRFPQEVAHESIIENPIYKKSIETEKNTLSVIKFTIHVIF